MDQPYKHVTNIYQPTYWIILYAHEDHIKYAFLTTEISKSVILFE